MKNTSKLLITMAVGGILLGLGLSRYASPTMNQASGPDWRERYRMSYSDTAMQYVDAGPIDLTPSLAWPGGPFGLRAMMQDPLDYGPTREAEYTATELATTYDTDEDLATDPSREPEPTAPPVQQALQAAAIAAETLDQSSTDQFGDVAPRADQAVSPNSFGAANRLPVIGAPTPL